MAKASKKRRRQAPKEKEKPTAVLHLETDLGLIYVKLIIRYRDCMTERSDLQDQIDTFGLLGGVERESSNVGSEIEQLDQKMHQLELSLVDIGGKLKTDLYKAGVEADLIKRLELRGWLDDSLYEDLCVRLDEWRCKKSDRTGVNESPLMADPIANHKLARLAKLDPTWVSKQIKQALEDAGKARTKVEPGHARWWSHKELLSACSHLPDGRLKKVVESQTFAKRVQTGANGVGEDSVG